MMGRLYQESETDRRLWRVSYLSLYKDCISPGVVKYRHSFVKETVECFYHHTREARWNTGSHHIKAKPHSGVWVNPFSSVVQPEMYDPRERSGLIPYGGVVTDSLWSSAFPEIGFLI